MSKRRLKKPAKLPDCGDRLRKALAKRTKDDLMDALVELAREDRNILRRLGEHPSDHLGVDGVGDAQPYVIDNKSKTGRKNKDTLFIFFLS